VQLMSGWFERCGAHVGWLEMYEAPIRWFERCEAHVGMV